MSDLLPTEREVRSLHGFRKGQRVTYSAQTLAEWGAAGMSVGGIAQRRVPARIKRIVVHVDGRWNSAELEHESGLVGWAAVEDLQALS